MHIKDTANTNDGKGNMGKRMRMAICGLLIFASILATSSYGPVRTLFAPKTVQAADAWWNNSWQKRVKINFSNASRGALTDFPVAVYLNSGRVTYADFSSNGNDIRFIDADGVTSLNYEIENWNPAGTSTLWVKVPNVASSNADYVYMYYGNSGATANATTTGVWDSNYLLVDHMTNNPGGTAPQSVNSVTNTAIGTTTNIATTTGVAGLAYDFNGTSAYLGWATSTFPTIHGGTLELWADADTLTSDRYLFSHVKANQSLVGEWRLYIDSANSFKYNYKIECAATANTVLSDAAASTATGWAHIAAVWDDSAGSNNQKLYVNSAAQVSTGSPTCGMDMLDSYAAGRNNALGSSYFDGQMDEIRLSSTPRSADWISATYASIKDTFNAYDAGEAVPGQPSGLATYPYDSRTHLRWSPASGIVTDYVVEYKLASAGSWSVFAEGTSTATSTMVTGLTDGSPYNFRITAVNDFGPGVSSAQATSTPGPLMTFINPTISNGNSTTSAAITAFASTTAVSPQSFGFRIETAGGAFVAASATTTRYGDYNISNLATTTNKQNLAITGDLSGLVYVPTTDTLFTIHNNQNTIHEITRAGVNVRTITCSACNDAEDITLVSSIASSTVGGFDHTFLISTEDVNTLNHQVFRVVIHSTGAATVDRTNYYSTGISSGSVANSGLEGAAYNPNTGYFFAAAEGQESSTGVPGTPKLYEVVPGNIATHSAVNTQICTNINFATLTLNDSSLFPASPGYSDISGLYFEPSNNHLYVLSHIADKMFELDVTSTSSCSVLREKKVYARADNGANFLYEMPEGISWDATGDYIYVGTEADYLSVWRTTSYGVRNRFSGLTDGTYVMYAAVTDGFGNVSTSSPRTFTVNNDLTGPVITPGSNTISTSSAIINWTTDENASSSVAYGLTASYGTVSTSSGHVTHSVTLSGLSPSTTYHYMIHAVDAFGNSTDTSDATFTTSAYVAPSGGNDPGSNSVDAPSPAVVVPGSQTAVSMPTLSSEELKAIFGNKALLPQADPLAGNVNAANGERAGEVIGSGAVISQAYAEGKRAPEMRTVQRLLNAFADTRVASTGIGSPGRETDLFGPATKRAVQKFQLKYGIVKNSKDPGYGSIGPKTRAKMNELLKRR